MRAARFIGRLIVVQLLAYQLVALHTYDFCPKGCGADSGYGVCEVRFLGDFRRSRCLKLTPLYACDVVAVASPCMMSTSFAQLTHDLDAYYFLQVDGTCSCKHDRAGVDCSLVRSLEIDTLSFSH